MAGKKRVNNEKKPDARGGRRPNQTGRPPKPPTEYDAAFKSAVEDAIKKLKKKHGRDYIEAAIEILYDDTVHANARASIFKTLSEIFVVKKSESHIKKEEVRGPTIFLPERKPDPALKVVTGGKE